MAQVVESSLYRQRSEDTAHQREDAEDDEEEVKKQLEDLGYL